MAAESIIIVPLVVVVPIVIVVAATLFLKVAVLLPEILISATLFAPFVPPISPVNVLTVPVMLICPSPAEAPAIAVLIVALVF